MVEIKLTKAQYKDLVKLVYLGDWMVNSIRTDDKVDKYEDIKQYIYSFANKGGLSRHIKFHSEHNKFFPTKEFEEDIDEYIDEYDNEVFWDELMHQLAKRDFIRKYGKDAIKEMTWEERLTKEYIFIEKYEMEFDGYGIENLEINNSEIKEWKVSELDN